MANYGRFIGGTHFGYLKKYKTKTEFLNNISSNKRKKLTDEMQELGINLSGNISVDRIERIIKTKKEELMAKKLETNKIAEEKNGNVEFSEQKKIDQSGNKTFREAFGLDFDQVAFSIVQTDEKLYGVYSVSFDTKGNAGEVKLVIGDLDIFEAQYQFKLAVTDAGLFNKLDKVQ